MKRCFGCNRQKEFDEFNYKNREKGTFQSQCKECTRKQVKKHYHNNVDYYIQKSRIRNKRERDVKRDYIWSYLRLHSCIDCSEKDIVVLTFDHVGRKTRNVADMISWNSSFKQIVDEIKECEVRCANCHMRKTAIQQGWLKK